MFWLAIRILAALMSRKPKQPTIVVVDLSTKDVILERNVYKLLVKHWWPHTLHGEYHVLHDTDAATLEFVCRCNHRFQISEEHAAEFGIILPD